MVLEDLNFFDVFVNQLGGSVFFGYLILIIIMLMIGYFTKMSNTLQMFWLGTFTLAWCMVFFGGIAGFIAFVIAAIWLFMAAFKYTSGGQI